MIESTDKAAREARKEPRVPYVVDELSSFEVSV